MVRLRYLWVFPSSQLPSRGDICRPVPISVHLLGLIGDDVVFEEPISLTGSLGLKPDSTAIRGVIDLLGFITTQMLVVFTCLVIGVNNLVVSTGLVVRFTVFKEGSRLILLVLPFIVSSLLEDFIGLLSDSSTLDFIADHTRRKIHEESTSLFGVLSSDSVMCSVWLLTDLPDLLIVNLVRNPWRSKTRYSNQFARSLFRAA